MRLSDRIRQERFTSPAQEALLNVLVTSAWLQGEIACAMAAFDVTPSQYNVLRILRGSHPQRLTCSSIGERLLDRTPDVTRLLDRLERAGLLVRQRAAYDRRVVEVGITPEGLRLLDEIDPQMEPVYARLQEALSEPEHQQLSSLLEKMRSSEM